MSKANHYASKQWGIVAVGVAAEAVSRYDLLHDNADKGIEKAYKYMQSHLGTKAPSMLDFSRYVAHLRMDGQSIKSRKHVVPTGLQKILLSKSVMHTNSRERA